MPLVITDAQFDEALDVLGAAIADVGGATTEATHFELGPVRAI